MKTHMQMHTRAHTCIHAKCACRHAHTYTHTHLRKHSKDSIATAFSSIHPRSAAAFNNAYSPDTWYTDTGNVELSRRNLQDKRVGGQHALVGACEAAPDWPDTRARHSGLVAQECRTEGQSRAHALAGKGDAAPACVVAFTDRCAFLFGDRSSALVEAHLADLNNHCESLPQPSGIHVSLTLHRAFPTA